MKSPLYASRVRVLLGKTGHQHRCGHGDYCNTPTREDCLKCRRDGINRALAREYAEDQMTTEELLNRAG